MNRKIVFILFITASVFFAAACSDDTGIGVGYTGPGLGTNFNIFDSLHDGAEIVFYIDVNLANMDTRVDNPTPSATVSAIEYTSCSVTVSNSADGLYETYNDTVIRYKGNTTLDKPKRQYKIKFRKSNRFHNLRRINLHSGWKDATLIREKLVYDFFNAVGVVAPRANHIRVYLRDTGGSGGYVYKGLYTAVEQVDKTFLRDRFGISNDEGNLYKSYYGKKGSSSGFGDLRYIAPGTAAQYMGGNGWAKQNNARAYRLRTNEDTMMDDYRDLASLINSISTGGISLGSYLDVDGFIKWLAANTLVGGWDNYWMNQQNFYLYNQTVDVTAAPAFKWIAWDYDNSMGNNFQDHNGFYIESEDIYYSSHTENTLIHKVLAVPAWKTAYTNYLVSFMNSHFNSSLLNARIDELKTKLQSYADSDTLKQYTDAEWAGNMDSSTITYSDEDGQWGNQAAHLGIKNYISLRIASVNSQL